METFYDGVRSVLGLGLEPKDLEWSQVCLRGVIVFVAALIMVRFGDRRFLSRKTAFDAILGFILASMLARAVNGSAPFFSTLIGGFVLVMLHRFIAFLTRFSHRFGVLVKGDSDCVIKDGRVIEESLKANDLSMNDLMEDLRLRGRVAGPEDVREARFERNGDISVIPRKA